MRLVLVRHGETAGQSSIRYYGATDVPLSAVGRAQMERAAAAVDHLPIDTVYASALMRSREGARIVARREPIVLGGFNEIDFGDWEGLTESEIRARDPRLHAQWRAGPADFHYPGGESTATFRTRVAATLWTVVERAQQDGDQCLLMVLHKGVIRTILAALLDLDSSARSQLAVDLGSIHIVASTASTWCATRLDDVAHLEALGRTEGR
ncbi:MAG TPA: histidine phosphatase family protein [Candidatus Binatia bacterium]|nr:histidine phosphatase family protein [Candidatus Binatia bacterium]